MEQVEETDQSLVCEYCKKPTSEHIVIGAVNGHKIVVCEDFVGHPQRDNAEIVAVPPHGNEPPIPLTLGEMLDCLVEECAEVIQAAQKCKRFGFVRVEPGYGRNSDVLASELGDVIGIMRELPIDFQLMEATADRKIHKIAALKKRVAEECAAG